MHGRASEVDHFYYQLARDLGKTIREIMELDTIEILNWRAYYVAEHSIENQRTPGA